MIKEDQNIKCAWCQDKSTAKEWNDTTYDRCVSREMRRSYVPIFLEKTFRRSEDTFYKCPKCSMWMRGCQLSIVDTDDKKLLRLGGEPIYEIVKQN